MNRPHRVVLSIGSNVADGTDHVIRAIATLRELLTDCRDSGAYTTPALCGDGTTYVNAVFIGNYSGDIATLNTLCKTLEHTHGRDSEARRQRRVPLDLDIVMSDGEILRPKDYDCAYFRQGYSRLTSH